jgi:hypothetical protein
MYGSENVLENRKVKSKSKRIEEMKSLYKIYNCKKGLKNVLGQESEVSNRNGHGR